SPLSLSTSSVSKCPNINCSAYVGPNCRHKNGINRSSFRCVKLRGVFCLEESHHARPRSRRTRHHASTSNNLGACNIPPGKHRNCASPLRAMCIGQNNQRHARAREGTAQRSSCDVV